MTATLYSQFELAGMVGLEGFLRVAWWPIGEARPPLRVRLDAASEHLHWLHPQPGEPSYIEYLKRPAANPSGMLDAFVRIKGADDVLRFARRYGPLSLCEHGLPASHRPVPRFRLDKPPADSYCRPVGYPSNCSEPVGRWYFYVRLARALLEIGAASWQERPGSKTSWKDVFDEEDDDYQDRMLAMLGESVAVDRLALSAVASDRWLDDGNLRLNWFWAPRLGEPLSWLGNDTFSLLAVQLVAALSRAGDMAICDGCSRVYPRKRRAQRKRRNFCPACGVKVSNRLRQRDLRVRRKEGTNHVQTS